MVSLVPLEDVGYNPAFFKLPIEKDGTMPFTYYTFDSTRPPGWENEWSILGLRYKDNSLVEIQIMYFDDDELSLKEFDPRYADGFLHLSGSTLLALIHFFETKAEYLLQQTGASPHHFYRQSAVELKNLHLTQWHITEGLGRYYLYLPDAKVQNVENISLICFPKQMPKHEVAPSSELEFLTFERQRLADPQFHPFDIPIGSGTMVFDRPALEEFIELLKQCIL